MLRIGPKDNTLKNAFEVELANFTMRERACFRILLTTGDFGDFFFENFFC